MDHSDSALHRFGCPQPGVQIGRHLSGARIVAVEILIAEPRLDSLSHVNEADGPGQRAHPPSGWDAIQFRMSSALHTVTRTESFTGRGKVRAWMRRHKVDFENGTNASTWGCRKKPVSGSTGAGRDGRETVPVTAEVEVDLGMIWPCGGWRR